MHIGTHIHVDGVYTAYIVQSMRLLRPPCCLVRPCRVLLLLHDPEEGRDTLSRTARHIRHNVQAVMLACRSELLHAAWCNIRLPLASLRARKVLLFGHEACRGPSHNQRTYGRVSAIHFTQSQACVERRTVRDRREHSILRAGARRRHRRDRLLDQPHRHNARFRRCAHGCPSLAAVSRTLPPLRGSTGPAPGFHPRRSRSSRK